MGGGFGSANDAWKLDGRGWNGPGWWDDGSWWPGWEDASWWGPPPTTGAHAAPSQVQSPPTQTPTQASTQTAAQSLPPLAGPGDMKDEIQKFCDKYELSDEDRTKVADAFSKFGETWARDLRDLDDALSKARNPASLLQARLRELEALKGFSAKAKQGHLPGCMCPACKENLFARAVGMDNSSEAKSLNAAALVAYHVEQLHNTIRSAEENSNRSPAGDVPAGKSVDKGAGKGKSKDKGPVVLPTGDLLPEVKAFCARFAVTDRLQTKLMDTLRKRSDAEWRNDLAEMNRDLPKARNPAGLLVVKLGDIQKELNPNQLCFNYRAGTCTWGDKCRWSHDVAVGAERMDSSALLKAQARGTVAAPAVPEASAGGGSLGAVAANESGGTGGSGFDGSGGFGGGFGTGGSKVDKLLRRRRRSSSSDREPSRPRALRDETEGLPPGPWPNRNRSPRGARRSPRRSPRGSPGRDPGRRSSPRRSPRSPRQSRSPGSGRPADPPPHSSARSRSRDRDQRGGRRRWD